MACSRKDSEERICVSFGRDLRYCTNTRAETYKQNEMNGFIYVACQRFNHVSAKFGTHSRKVHMTYLPHYAGDLRSSRDTPHLALCRYSRRHAILVRLEDRRLMQAYRRSMYTHIEKHDIRIVEARR